MDKEILYKQLKQEVESLISSENHPISDMANIAVLLKQKFNFWWVGFYFVHNNNLVLGPFQGPIACTIIPPGKGVCGHSRAEKKTIIVEDVHAFPGHIACSEVSNSEIVVPLFNTQGEVVAVLDVDSENFSNFDEVDQHYLEEICRYFAQTHYQE